MTDLRKRPYQTGYAAAVAALFNTIDVHAGGPAQYLPADVDRAISVLVRDVDRDTSLLVGPDGDLVGAGVLYPPPDGGFRVELEGGIHPEWQGRGLGRQLLHTQLARAVEIHAAAGAPPQWRIQTTTITGDTGAIRLFERFGLAAVRYWFEMHAPLAEVAALPTPAGLRIVGYRPDLARTLYAAHVQAFADHWGFQRRDFAEWSPLIVDADTFRPELSMLCFDGDDLVGYALAFDSTEPQEIYVGLVGTRQQWRRRGIAAALLARLLGDARERGNTGAQLTVDADSPTGAVGVYERVGFSVQHRWMTFDRDLIGLAASLDPARSATSAGTGPLPVVS